MSVPDALVTSLAALLLPADSGATRQLLAARLRAVAAALEAAEEPPQLSGAAPPAAVPAAPAFDGADADMVCDEEEEPAAARRKTADGASAARKCVGFDMSRYAQRLVALEVFYAGWSYHGFATQGCVRFVPRLRP